MMHNTWKGKLHLFAAPNETIKTTGVMIYSKIFDAW